MVAAGRRFINGTADSSYGAPQPDAPVAQAFPEPTATSKEENKAEKFDKIDFAIQKIEAWKEGEGKRDWEEKWEPRITAYDKLTFFQKLNKFMIVYIGGCHLVALWAVALLLFFGGCDPVFPGAVPVKTSTLMFAAALWPITALGITAGCHRLWAHKTYKAHWTVRLFLMIVNSIASQGSIFHWARDHRVHHWFSDSEYDPHNSHRGFFYSHVGWLLYKKDPRIVMAGNTGFIDIQDLRDDKIVMWQDRNQMFMHTANFILTPLACMYFCGDTFWNAYLYAGMLRYVWSLNCTWSVNSIVHAIGPSPYDPDHPPAESRLVSVLAMGEGWHSWHHAFPFDYAAAEMNAFLQFNPTKMWIDTLAALGLIWGRKRKNWVGDANRTYVTAGLPPFRMRYLVENEAPAPCATVPNTRGA
jgi:stearoyl-CoA desaturase (delta-9 desaturase)